VLILLWPIWRTVRFDKFIRGRKCRRRSNCGSRKYWPATFRTPAGAAIARKRKLPTNKGKYKQRGSKTLSLQVPVVNYKKFIRACKNCINLLINVIRTGNFLNFISNFFLFLATFEQLLCFLASNFLVGPYSAGGGGGGGGGAGGYPGENYIYDF
jgi:hypothetical protein